MKYLSLYENMEVYSNEAFRLPYPNISFVNELFNKKLFYREEPAWVKCVYEIPSEAFESTSAVTVLNSSPGYINDYKINGVYGEVEPLRVEEGVEVDVFQPYTMEGIQGYLPTTDACFLTSDLTTETEFILSRPLNETDIIILVLYSNNEFVDLQVGGTVGNFGEDINNMFSFRSDTIYTYSDIFLETIKEQESTYEGMKIGFFIVNSEWNDNHLEAPSLNTTMIANVLHGGVQKLEVLPSMLDENNKVVIEYSLLKHDNCINSTFRNIDYLKEIDFTRLNSKNNSKRKFQIASEAFIDCSVLENVKIGDYIISIGDNAFDGCTSLPVYDNIYYADTYCVGVINNDVTSCIIKEGTKWINPNAFPNYASKLKSVVIPGSVISIPRFVFSYHGNLKTVEIENGVTSIDEGAFRYCSGLTGELIIPDSITSIGDSAFNGCSGLTSVEIGSGCTSIGYEVFYKCDGLTGELVIPDSVKSIGERAFQGCTGLTSLEIGSGVTSIGVNAFNSCRKLETIVVSSGNAVYDSRENCNCIIKTSTNTLIQGCNNSFIPDSVTSIGSNAFYYYYWLTGELVIPDSVNSIGDNAFRECFGLTSVEIGSGCTSIGEGAFRNCSRLNKITCHALTAPSISSNTFQNVSTFGKLIYPEGSDYSSWLSTDSYYLGYSNWFIKEIGVELPELTLDGYDVAMLVQPTTTGSTKICDKTTSIAEIKVNDTVLDSISTGHTFGEVGKWNVVRVKYTDDVTSIPSSCFSGCTRMYEVKIADSVTSIGTDAFKSCSGLTSVVIPDSVTSIDTYAFHYCTGLTSVVIPDSVTSIGNGAFSNCKKLTNVEIGSGVTSIDMRAFYECSGLEEIICHAVTAPSITNDTFYNVKSNGILYVPSGSDYSSWMSTDSYYLGYRNWTQQSIA